MSNILEQIESIQQATKALGILAGIIVAIALLAFLSPKILGVLLAAGGLAMAIWFPTVPTYQPAHMTGTAIKLGIILFLIGVLLVIFG